MSIPAILVQLIGAGKESEARAVLRQSLLATVLFSMVLVAAGTVISFPLPVWLGAGEEIRGDSAAYFLIFIISLPAIQMNQLAGSFHCSIGGTAGSR